MTIPSNIEETERLLPNDAVPQICDKQPTTTTDSSRNKKKCCYRAVYGGLLLILVAAAGLCLMSDSRGITIKYHLLNCYDSIFGGYGSDNPSFSCSSHGVQVSGNRCLCDTGFAGDDCSKALADIPTAKPKPDTICLVLDSFGSLGPSRSSQANVDMATTLAKAGYTVTVLYTGLDNPQFTTVSSIFSKKGIFITKLPDTGLNFGENSIEASSYSVYQYMIRYGSQFSHVYFSASSGNGYYTLLAQSQGLFCSDTVFINGMDVLPVQKTLQVESGDSNAHVVVKDLLKLDYFMRKTAELADLNVFSSNVVFDEVLSSNWTLNKETAHVISKAVNKVSEHTIPSEVITELVFAGPMTIGGGLMLFCDAIDEMLEQLKSSKVSITFLVLPGTQTVKNMKPEEYVELRSLNWDSFEIKWQIHPVADAEDIMSYLSTTGRLAVFPTLNDPVAELAQTIAYSKIPIVVSANSALSDMLSLSDRARSVTSAESKALSSKLSAIVTKKDVIPVVQGQQPASASSWIKVLESGRSKACVATYELQNDKPLVSVVLVHHNRHLLLKQAIESLNSQTYKNFEVIIVDDGSTDPVSLQYVRELSWKWWETKGWKVLFETNRYLGAARNTGAKAATGKYVLFLDDDDYSKPHHIETLVRVAINTDADIISGGHDVFSGRARPSKAISESRFLPIGSAPLVGMLQNIFGDSAIMVRREFFIEVAGFTEDYGVGFEDYEFLARSSLKQHKMQAVPEALHWYRHHGNTMSTSTNLKTNQLRMLRPYIESNPYASDAQKSVFAEVQKLFFEKYGVAFNENPFGRRDNATNTGPPVVPPVGPFITQCQAFFDGTGSSKLSFQQQPVWAADTLASCWNMGANSPPTAQDPNAVYVNQAIQPVYPDGSSAGYPIVQVAPCNPLYSDVWNLLQVVVDQSTPFNNYKSFDSLQSTNALSYGFFNRPAVPPGSGFQGSQGVVLPTIQQGWYQNQPLYYVDFGAIPGTAAWDTTVAAGKIADVKGSGPVATDASSKSSGFYSLGGLDPRGAIRYSDGDFTDYLQLTYPFNPLPPSQTLEVLNCPFISSASSASPATDHKTDLYGLEPEITPKTAGVKVTLWGSSFTASSVVYVNGVAYSGTATVISSEYITITLDFTQFDGSTGSVNIYVDDSLTYVVRYYSVQATISSISTKSTLFTKTANQEVDITGVYLPQLSGGFCVFNITALGVATPLTVTSPTTAYCSFPKVAHSGVYSVSVAMAASKYDIPSLNYIAGNYYQFPLLPTASGDAITTLVIAHGPKALSARFGNSGASIIVDVDSPASVINTDLFNNKQQIQFVDSSFPLSCASIFATDYDASQIPAIGKLSNGVTGDCFVIQLTPTKFKIQLQAAFTAYDPQAIVPSNAIRILSGSLWAANETYVQTYSSVATVAVPAIIPAPQVSIISPLFVPWCDSLIIPLDLTSTSGSAGRNYTSNSTFTFTSTDLGSADSTAQLTAFLNSCLENISWKAVCEIPIAKLWKSSTGGFNTYEFTVSLQNYLGAIGSQTVTVNVGSDSNTPYLTLAGVPENNAKIDKFQILEAQVESVCGITTNVQTQWNVAGSTCPGLQNATTNGTSQFIIPPYSLKPQSTCSISVNVKYASQSTWITASTSFKTAAEVLYVTAGNSKTAGPTDSLSLGASIFSSAYSSPSTSQYSCAWSCVSGDTGFLCPSSISALLKGCSSISLASKLPQGKYEFNVLVQDSVTGAKALSESPSIVVIGNSSVPAITISYPSGKISSYSDKFALTANVDPSTVSSLNGLKYSWSNCDEPKWPTIDFTKQSNFMTNPSDPSSQVLKFAPGVLTADNSYCVAVSVTDASGNTGYSAVSFSTYEVPFGGFCRLQAASVSEINEPLQYSCPYWSLDPEAQPLTFEFYVKGTNQSVWTLVSPSTRSAELSSTFASGDYSIRVTVSDDFGSTSSGVASAFSASTNPSLSSLAGSLECSTSACYILKNALAVYLQTGNSKVAAKAIGAAALQIEIGSPDFDTILYFLYQFSGSVYIDASSIGPFLVSVLQTIVGNGYSLPTDSINDLLGLLHAVLLKVSDSGKLEYPASCVNVQSAESAFLVLDQLYGTYSNLGLSTYDRQNSAYNLNTALDVLESCFARNKAPQEIPYSFSSGYITRNVGCNYKHQKSSYCNFQVTPSSPYQTGEIVSYSCGTKSSGVYPPANNGLYGIDNSIEDLSIWNQHGQYESSVYTNFSIPMSKNFINQYGLSSSQPSYKPTCSFYVPSSGEWSQDGCVTVGTSNGQVYCSCSHLTDFVVGSVQTSATSGFGIGFIIACVIGAIALIVATAGTVYHIKKQQNAKLAAANGALLPTTTPPQLPPSVDASVPAVTTPDTAALTEIVTAPPKAPILEGVAAVAAVAATAVVAAAVKPLPSYTRPPSYEFHMSRLGR